jgi:signal transduction histidine kinase
MPCWRARQPAMLKDIEKRFVRTQFLLLALFAWGTGFLYVVSTVLFNPVQLRWELFCFTWEALAIGVPLIVFRPMFRPIQRYARRLEAGEPLTLEEAERCRRALLSYPFKVSVEVLVASTVAYALGALQVRYFAHLPVESVAITSVCGLASGLLWGVLEYFLLEYDLRPLTGLLAKVPGLRPPAKRVSLTLKIFVSSLALVVASLSFFGIVAYTRAERNLEQEIGLRLSGRMRELANLVGALPRGADHAPSDAWWMLAAEFPVSPRGYFHLIDARGRILATHPASAAAGERRLQDEALLPAVREQVLRLPEGHLVDRVNESRIVSFVTVPGTAWKIVALAPLADFDPQLNQLLYSGLAGMAFALCLTLVIGFLCARSITVSLAEVTRAAQAVADKRDLRQRASFVTNDEVGVLAHAFNRMAAELQGYAEGLERQVAERTRQLALRTEQLEAKNRELGDFLYIASHDLRAPLINLSGFSRALQESMARLAEIVETGPAAGNGAAAPASEWPQLKEEIDESVDFILRSVARMDTLVNALLDLSRIETRPHVPQSIDTGAMVNEIFAAFRFQITEKKIHVSAADLPAVVGDPLRINQVFSNLIDNAIKYMPPGEGARIDVGCETRADSYRFFVRDTGRGIRAQDHEKVFRLFTRLDGNGIPGDGVGLAAVRKIVERHGGKAGVDSAPGAGSTFWFTLPRPDTPNADAPATA